MSRIFASTIVWLMPLLICGCAPPASPSLEQTTQHAGERFEIPPERHAHLASLGVPRWQEQVGRGKGVTIAVLDSGFRGYRRFLGKGLPPYVKVRSFRADSDLEARDSQHGILCAEVLHAIAPDADLLLLNWDPESPAAFLDAVRWAKTQGAKIISCSLIMPSWSDGEGGGAVHRALATILGGGDSPGDALFFASAGNTAQRHWCGEYDPDAAGWHYWREGITHNTLTPTGGERVAVELYGPTCRALELSVRNADDNVVGRSILRVDATRACGRAVVRFQPAADAYRVCVRCLDRSAAGQAAFHVAALGGTLEVSTSRGSIAFPGDGARVCAVGAVDGHDRRMYYSSCGPNSKLPKPDLMAPVPFPSACRDKPFAGTSAAAPQAAGLAALVWSSRPDATAHQIARVLRDAALDLGPPGHDPETGHGRLRLPRKPTLEK